MHSITMKMTHNFSGIIPTILSFFIFQTTIAHEGNNHDHIQDLNIKYRLYEICKNDLEGFSEKLGGGMYTYPSLREDVGQAMISRASTGKMYFEF